MTLKVQFNGHFETTTHTSFKNYILRKHLFNFNHHVAKQHMQQNIVDDEEQSDSSDSSSSHLPVAIVNLSKANKDSATTETNSPVPSTSGTATNRIMRCTECDKLFTHRGDFNKHKRTHSGEKPYTCTEPYCGKTFAHSSNLRRHIVVHSGDKPFSCDKCGKCFNRKDKLLLHQQTRLCKKRSQSSIKQ